MSTGRNFVDDNTYEPPSGTGTPRVSDIESQHPGHGPPWKPDHTTNERKIDHGLIPKRRTRGMHVRFSRIPGETPNKVLYTPLWLPAVIGSIGVSLDYSSGYQDYMTLSAGMFTTPPAGDPNARVLRTLDQLNTLVLWWDAPWLIEHGLSHNSVESTLNKIVNSKRPVQMLMTLRTKKTYKPWLRCDVTIRGYREELRELEPDTNYYALSITEWRDPSVERRGGGKGRKAGIELPTRTRLRNTDTLSSLSMEFYGTYKHWRLIRDANGITHKLGSHGIIVYNSSFQTGHWIKIPAIEKKHKHKKNAFAGGVNIKTGTYTHG